MPVPSTPDAMVAAMRSASPTHICVVPRQEFVEEPPEQNRPSRQNKAPSREKASENNQLLHRRDLVSSPSGSGVMQCFFWRPVPCMELIGQTQEA